MQPHKLVLLATTCIALTACSSTMQSAMNSVSNLNPLREEPPLGLPEGQFAEWADTDPAYRFFPGDTIDVTVHTAPELSRTALIGPDGRVSLPLLPNIMVADRTDVEIANVIADAYNQDMLRDPIVEVRRSTLGPQNIIVGGQVNTPGLVAMPSAIGALEAVMLAGGFQDSAARGKVVVLRRAPGGGLMMREVDLHRALDGGRGSDQIQLRRHDIVFVPRSTVAEVTNFMQQYVYGVLPLDQAFSYAIANEITN